MAFDMSIIVVGQKKELGFVNNTKLNISTISEKSLEEKFVYNVNGIRYWIETYDEESVFPLEGVIDTDFDKTMVPNHYSWITDPEILENITPIEVSMDYLEDFKKVISILIGLSPVKMVIILARYQGGDTEIIQGPIPYKKYIEMLEKQKIPFNVYSIVKGEI